MNQLKQIKSSKDLQMLGKLLEQLPIQKEKAPASFQSIFPLLEQVLKAQIEALQKQGQNR